MTDTTDISTSPRPRASVADVLRSTEAAFTANQLAAPLGLTGKAVRKRLPKGTRTKEVRGQQTPCWPLSQLPTEWRERLQQLAREKGFRSVDAFLISEPRQRWTTQEETSEPIAAEFIEAATRRREVYVDALHREREEPAPTRAEILAMVRPLQKRVFGYDISDDRHDDILRIARERDRDFGEFHRVELYLGAAAFRATATEAKAPAADQAKHAALLPVLDELASRTHPDADDIATVFDRAFRHFEGLSASTPDTSEHRAIKRSLIDWLLEVFPCPILSTTRRGLERAFNRDFATWKAEGRNPESLCPNYAGGRPAYVCKPCFAKVNARARKLRGQGGMGNTTLAYRQLRTSGELCPACSGNYKFNVAENKSYVPRSFRIGAAPNKLELGKDKGQRHMEAAGPKIERDWIDTDPADYFVSDDETSNHIVWTRINGKLVIGRLQILHMMDLKSIYPIDFVAYFGPPLAVMIRKLICQVAVEGAGMPHQGFLFERSHYAAKMIIGAGELPWRYTTNGFLGRYGLRFDDASEGARAVHRENLECGLSEPGLDLKVRQANRPWSKPIEGTLHIFQKMMSGLRGFVGFNERNELPDNLKGIEQRCRDGKENPNDHFPSLDEYVAKYRSVLEEFRHEPQPKSKRLRGASPFQAWNDGQDRRPLRKLSEEEAWLLATHKKPVTLRADGLVMEINGHRQSYANRQLGEWYGRGVREVLAFYNIEFPHLLHVSDMKRKHFITLRHLSAPSMTAHCTSAGRGRLAESERNKRDYMAAATQRFSGLQHPVINTITRDTDRSDENRALGQHINAAVEAERARQVDQVAAAPMGNRLAEAHGLGTSTDALAPVRKSGMSERERELRERLDAKRNNAPTITTS